MTLSQPDELGELDQAMTDVEDSLLRRPIAWWRAWHRDPPRTSQREALGLIPTCRTIIILGGNRTGKTELMRAALVALALGSDHPDAREFWRANDVDPEPLPAGPGRVWIVALTSSDSLRYHRKQVLRLIPRWGPRHPMSRGGGRPFHHWNMNGNGEGLIEVMCPGYAEPAQVYFKSEDQGDDAMQGDSCRAILHDEEGKTPKTWDEADIRLWDQDGWHIMTNTPKDGITWVYHRFVAPSAREVPEEDSGEASTIDAQVRYLHSEDNPHITKRRLLKLKHGDQATVAARTRGEFVVLGERWWPEFSRQLHVLPADTPIPGDSLLYGGIDFGTRHPFVHLWAAYLRHAITLRGGRRIPEGSTVIYREHYRAEWTIPQHVTEIRRAEGWLRLSELPEAERRLFRPETDEDRRRVEEYEREHDGMHPIERAGWGRPGVEGWVRPRGTGERLQLRWADPEDPQQILQLRREHELHVIAANKARKAGHDAVAEELHPDETGEPRLYVLESCPHTISEWERYVRSDRGESTEGGQVDRPVSRDDHTCDVARYLVLGIRASRAVV